jgi:signal transduction histidine kinase
MSHELRTPVSTVLGYTELLCEGDAGALSPTAARMIRRIARSARHLRELIDDLLDISRLAAGKVTVAQAEVSLLAIVRDTFAAIEPQARAKGLVLELLGSDVPQVCTDARRVRQVLLNLISNAVRCTERGGVTVVLERRPPGAVAVHVIDTGVGIAAEDQERVFDEFVQVGTPHGGTGLGLPISRRLAGLLGGSLTLRSAPGRGSCFTLTLPVANAAADAPPARQAE